MPSISKLALLERNKEYGVIFIRLIIGCHLIYGTQDNVFSYGRMEEFAGFLQVRAVPYPLFSAFLSAYAQFICGILFILGAATRYAAVAMVINFIAALIIAHIGDTYPNMFPALMMLSAAWFLLIHGAGKLSVDDMLWRRRKGIETWIRLKDSRYPGTGSVYVYVADVDAVHARALSLGAGLLATVVDKPYQERQGGFIDAAGKHLVGCYI